MIPSTTTPRDLDSADDVDVRSKSKASSATVELGMVIVVATRTLPDETSSEMACMERPAMKVERRTLNWTGSNDSTVPATRKVAEMTGK